MEQEREEGQALLRSMILKEDEIDWGAVIAKADALHRREQAWLRRRSRKERILFRKRQRKALQRRRRFDAIGSFNVNLVTYRLTEVYPTDKFEVETSVKSAIRSTTSIGSSQEEESYGLNEVHITKKRSLSDNRLSQNQLDSLDPIDERHEVMDDGSIS